MLEPVLRAAWDGLQLVLAWPNVLYPIAGTLLAMAVAFLPGISGVTLMALVLPFTLFWEPLPVVLTFGGLVGGATFMGSVTAILFNVPGSGPSAATLLDGYPMAQQGRARTAIGCAATASALGSSIGIVVLVCLIPLMQRAILAFGPPELLMLLLWGLTTIAIISKGSLARGLIAAGVGLLLAFIGQDPRTGELRFTFGSFFLWEGLGLIPVTLGLFSIAEMIELGQSSRVSISGSRHVAELAGSVREGVASVFRHGGLLVRSALIGTSIGVIPGVGGTVASFLAYGHAVRSAPDPDRFGHGDIRGVIAPEAAHDAKDGGALVPLLALGIPGSDGTAVLMAVLVLHGITPGRELMTDHLPLVFVLIWSLFLSNWLTSLLGLALVNPLTRLTTVRLHRLVPVVLVLAAVGAYVDQHRFGDVLVAFLFGIVGASMKKHQWPRIPLVVALLLGDGIERNLHITLTLYDLGRVDFWSRPLLVLLVVLVLTNLLLPYLRRARQGTGSRAR